MATIEESLTALHEEISIIEKEVKFWFDQMELIEKEWLQLEEDQFGFNNSRREELSTKAGEIYKRMQNEIKLLADFRERYNKLAKKNKLPLIE